METMGFNVRREPGCWLRCSICSRLPVSDMITHPWDGGEPRGSFTKEVAELETLSRTLRRCPQCGWYYAVEYERDSDHHMANDSYEIMRRMVPAEAGESVKAGERGGITARRWVHARRRYSGCERSHHQHWRGLCRIVTRPQVAGHQHHHDGHRPLGRKKGAQRPVGTGLKQKQLTSAESQVLPTAPTCQLKLASGCGGEGRIPGQIAEKLAGRRFKNWDEFREAFWKEVAADPVLTPQFNKRNRTLMAQENRPLRLSFNTWARIRRLRSTT